MSQVTSMQPAAKLEKAVQLAIPLLPPGLANQIKALLTPEALATMLTSYSRSYVLRYLEEALAETVAQCRAKGLKLGNVKLGLRFPAAGGYITLTNLRTEAVGILLGPVNAGAMLLNAYYSLQPKK
jgi:hypothetical protein